MASGVPCVSTGVGDARLIVGGCGVLIPPQDADALAQGMAKMIGIDPKHRYQLGMESRQRIVGQFDVGRMISAYRSLYMDLVK